MDSRRRFMVDDVVLVEQIGGRSEKGRVEKIHSDGLYSVRYRNGASERVSSHLLRPSSPDHSAIPRSDLSNEGRSMLNAKLGGTVRFQDQEDVAYTIRTERIQRGVPILTGWFVIERNSGFWSTN